MIRRFWTYKIREDAQLTEVAPDPYSLDEGRLNRLIKSNATGRYCYHNLKLFRLRGMLREAFGRQPQQQKQSNTDPINKEEQQKMRREKVKLAVNYTIQQFKLTFPDKRIIFSLDGLRHAIYENEPLEGSPLNWMRLMLKEACTNYNIEFIDLSIPFQADYQKHQQLLNFEIDSHWNAYAHHLVAQTIYDYLKTTPVEQH